jgi:hypothetical protein
MTDENSTYIPSKRDEQADQPVKLVNVIASIKKNVYEPRTDKTTLTIEIEGIGVEDAMLLTKLGHTKKQVRLSLETTQTFYK